MGLRNVINIKRYRMCPQTYLPSYVLHCIYLYFIFLSVQILKNKNKIFQGDHQHPTSHLTIKKTCFDGCGEVS